MPNRDAYATRSSELPDPRLVGRPRKELATLCAQEALFVIPRSALKRGTKTVRRKICKDMKGELVKNRFVAAEVASDVRYDVQAGTPASKALTMIIHLAATCGSKRRPRSLALCGIVAAIAYATIDELVTVLTADGLMERERRVLPLVEGAVRHLKGFKEVAAALHDSIRGIRMARSRGNGWNLPPSRSCGYARMPWRRWRAEESDELLTQLDTITWSEFQAKLLGRVGRRHLPEIKFLQRTFRCMGSKATG